MLNIYHCDLQYHLYYACISQIVQCCNAVHTVAIKIIQSSLQGFEIRLCFALAHPLIRVFFPLGLFLFIFIVFSIDSQLCSVFMSLSALVSKKKKGGGGILHFCNSLSIANGKEVRRLTISHALSLSVLPDCLQLDFKFKY